MEALRELEKVQSMLSFLESHRLSSKSSHRDYHSHRFLAHFLLFLVQPCGELSVTDKYLLVSELLTKVTSEILEEVQLFARDEGFINFKTDFPSHPQFDTKIKIGELRSAETPLIGFDAMQRANSTLVDFCRSYFMFHGMDSNKPESIFKFLPFLSFTESYIYQLDASNENNLNLVPEEIISPKGSSDIISMKNMKNYDDVSTCSISFDPLIRLLQSNGLMTDRIRDELKSGIEYWRIETKLCQSLARKDKISIEDAMRAIHLKSFDYRVLNLLLYQLTGQEVNALHMEFLSVSEFLVEVSDDLYDYEDDVMNNTFNILRMFVSVYGASDAPKILAKWISDTEERYESLSKKLDPELSVKYWRRCEEATKEGGGNSGHTYGKWTIPPVIVDEDTFRVQNIQNYY